MGAVRFGGSHPRHREAARSALARMAAGAVLLQELLVLSEGLTEAAKWQQRKDEKIAHQHYNFNTESAIMRAKCDGFWRLLH